MLISKCQTVSMVTRIRGYAQIIHILWNNGFGIASEKAFPGKTRLRLPGTGTGVDHPRFMNGCGGLLKNWSQFL